MHPLLADITSDHNQSVLIWTLVVTNVVQLVTNLAQMVNGIFTRREDREDRKLEMQALNNAGAMREVKIMNAVETTRTEVAHALKTANGHNEKIAEAVTAVKTLASQPPPTVIIKKELSPGNSTDAI